jgi:putative membrane protein insertion efficiency factor
VSWSHGSASSREGPLTSAPARGQSVRRLLLALVAAPIRAYQRLISPALPRRCKYEPTCSAYALDAIRLYGPARGLVLAAWRVMRCNPFSHGGYDPAEQQTLFGVRSGSGRNRANAETAPKVEA